MRQPRATAVLFLLVFAAAVGCARGPLVTQAIGARGGPLSAAVRDSEVAVTLGFPGTWRWRTVTAAPDRYAWTIFTTGAPLHHLYDGAVTRAYVGSALSAEDTSPNAPLRSHARFMAVLDLRALDAPGVHVRELDSAGLEITFADGERFVVALDPHALIISVEGHVDLPPYGRPLVRAVLDDWRRVDGYRIAHHVVWTVDGRPLADERIVRACVLAEALPATAFAAPDTLPACP